MRGFSVVVVGLVVTAIVSAACVLVIAALPINAAHF